MGTTGSHNTAVGGSMMSDNTTGDNNTALGYNAFDTGLNYEFSGIDKPKNKTDYYGLRYAEFVIPLVKTIQEQQDQYQKF